MTRRLYDTVIKLYFHKSEKVLTADRVQHFGWRVTFLGNISLRACFRCGEQPEKCHSCIFRPRLLPLLARTATVMSNPTLKGTFLYSLTINFSALTNHIFPSFLSCVIIPKSKMSNFIPHTTTASKFRALLTQDEIIVCPGVYDGFTARLALNTGFKVLYMVRSRFLFISCFAFIRN